MTEIKNPILFIYCKMKNLLLCISLIIICFGCAKSEEKPTNNDDTPILEKNNISDGHYMGHFVLDNINYWCSIEISNKTYGEWPSGGIMYQKDMGCLTTGSIKIIEDIITFTLDSYKFPGFPCDIRMPLPGEYRINLITLNDSLIFSKGLENNKIKYYIKKVD
jgi:hypothetical protein